MADAIKAQKLAAARKRLKEYQKTGKKVTKKDEAENVDGLQKYPPSASSDNITPVDSMASSTHSIVFENPVSGIQEQPERESSEAAPLEELNVENMNSANFFNQGLFQNNDRNILSNYFGSASENVSDTTLNLDAFSKNFAALQINADASENKNQNIEYADPFSYAENKIISLVPNNLFTGSINQDIFDAAQNLAVTAHPTLKKNPIEEIPQINTLIARPVQLKNDPIEEVPQIKPLQFISEESKSECALQFEIPLNSNSDNQTNIFSNTESLRQLSSQLNSLIDSEDVQTDTETSHHLEIRNQELALLLKNEQMKNDELNLQLREYLTRISQLELESKQTKNEQEAKMSREVGPLQDQLQYHIQRVGILVGEKTELTMALNQSQTTAKQKTSECEELHGRLKASRHRVAELEKEVNYLKSFKDNIDKHGQENHREVERLRLDYNLLKEVVQEATEESSELKEKLNAKTNECLQLQQEVREKNSQLSLSHLKIQQLTIGETTQIESQLEMYNQQKISLEQQVTELSETVKVVTSERDQANQQYQQYVQQLNGQIQSLAEALETKNKDHETLANREQSLVKHISDLEKHLQQLQSERQVPVPNKIDVEADIKRLEDAINNLQTEKNELEENLKLELEKQILYEEQILEKDSLIMDLEGKVDQLQDQPDAGKLLATMESDKVAASRAVEQNKKLKQQLEELHEGFIKMSNSKLELTEKLEHEQYQSKELTEKLNEVKPAIEHLHSVIAGKDKELIELQKQILHQNQLTDRLRHYEVQGSSSDMLQQELQQSRVMLEQMKLENEKLKTKLAQKFKELKMAQLSDLNDDIVNKESVGLLKNTNEPMVNKSNLEIEINKNGDSVEEEKSEQPIKERPMAQLEERFKKTMVEIADLTEEKQRLEHLVMQLQSETETIGEYVALYQCQRALLKEKTSEKDEQLQRLAMDREEMKIKLDELNALVQRLVVEKGVIPKEILNQHQYTLESCEIHKQDDMVDNSDKDKESKDNLMNGSATDNNNENFGTAGKIIALLSEIKTSNLVQPGDSIQNFHPCPWCSGQLITV